MEAMQKLGVIRDHKQLHLHLHTHKVCEQLYIVEIPDFVLKCQRNYIYPNPNHYWQRLGFTSLGLSPLEIGLAMFPFSTFFSGSTHKYTEKRGTILEKILMSPPPHKSGV